jgi:hypothetical protein
MSLLRTNKSFLHTELQKNLNVVKKRIYYER